jgi:hypothetical protein
MFSMIDSTATEKPFKFSSGFIVALSLTACVFDTFIDPHSHEGSYPEIIGIFIAEAIVYLLIPFLIAYGLHGHKKRTDSFRRWFFWSFLIIFIIGTMGSNYERQRSVTPTTQQ